MAYLAAVKTATGPDPDLRLILDHWADLPEPIRAGIVAMVKAAAGGR